MRVWKLSGEELVVDNIGDMSKVIELKRHICNVSGYSRFRQRLLHGCTVLHDNANLNGLGDVQLEFLPLEPPSEMQIATLTHAALDGDVSQVEKLLQHPVNPTLPDRFGMTALDWACSAGEMDMARVLLEAANDKDLLENGCTTALGYASYHGHASLAVLLLDAKARIEGSSSADGRRALQWAAIGGQADAVRLLLRARANPNSTAADGTAPLHSAAYYGYSIVVRLLLKAGAISSLMDNYGETPVHKASCRGHSDIAQLLLTAGASPCLNVDLAGFFGRAAWDAVFRAGRLDLFLLLHTSRSSVVCNARALLVEVTRFLLEFGPCREFVLHSACRAGHGDIVEVLLQSGAVVDISAGDDDGMTALHHAAFYGHAGIVDLLLEAQANPNLVMSVLDSPEMSAVDLASFGGMNNLQVMQSLMFAGTRCHATAWC
ncbi:ANKRD50 [Symbiodinium sp. CCMP2592]|nr:ANKRD50 [Symbiodinium sp. CCMP2592]